MSYIKVQKVNSTKTVEHEVIDYMRGKSPEYFCTTKTKNHLK